MGQVRILWAPAAGKVLEGSYTLSHGITPSVISLTCAPFAGRIPPVSDITFDDGERRLTFKDCLFTARGSDRSAATWRLQFLDRRWRWRFGVLVGEANQDIPDGMKPPAGSPQALAAWSAREIGEHILEVMRETNVDIKALPIDQYPSVKWDYSNPAKEMAELCDRYQLLVCYDPCLGKVSLCKRGQGKSLPAGNLVLADEMTGTQPPRPETLRAVTGFTEHEHDFALEPVGMDKDGSIKSIDELSYRPAGGWGNDVLLFAGVPDTEIADPNNPSVKTSAQKLAETCVYRWYRIVPAKVPGWRYLGLEWDNPQLAWLLPISGELVETIEVKKGSQRTSERRPAFVRGVFADDLERMAYTNSATGTVYPKKFDLDEKLGIVKFSEPVFKWASNAPAAAQLQLRCVVFGDRYTKDRDVGGTFGIEPIDCSHLTVQYRNGTAQNKGRVDAAADAILAVKADEYGVVQSGSRTYIGIQDLKLDGKVQQVTWSVGPGGATTQASESSEHDPWVPPEKVRRAAERGAARAYTPAPGGVIVPGNDTPASQFAQPRLQGASNGYAGEVPAFSLVRATQIASGIWTVNRPSADSQVHVMAVGPAKIPQNGTGLVSADWPLPVKYAGAAPAVGDERGTAANSFELTAGKKGFIVWAVDATNGLAWVAPAASAGGGGGTAALSAITVTLANNYDAVYSDNVALCAHIPGEAGTYLVAGSAVFDPAGAGMCEITLRKNGTAFAYALHNAAISGNDQLSLPMFFVTLDADDEVELYGYASGGSGGVGALGDETAPGATYLTVVGPLEMDVT